MKKIFDAFTNPTDAQRTYREIMFLQARVYTSIPTPNDTYVLTTMQCTFILLTLQEFSSHENVIQLLNVMRAHNDQDIYLVFEFMDTDLHAVIKAKILQPVHMQYIMYQVIESMKGNCKQILPALSSHSCLYIAFQSDEVPTFRKLHSQRFKGWMKFIPH